MNRNQNSKEQAAQERENQKQANKIHRQDTGPIVDKKLDGPNRPST